MKKELCSVRLSEKRGGMVWELGLPDKKSGARVKELLCESWDCWTNLEKDVSFLNFGNLEEA